MKANKTLVFTLLAAGSVVVACGAVSGQDTAPKTPSSMSLSGNSQASRMFGGWNVDKLAQQLGLTDAQKQKVQSILESEHHRMTDLHGNLSLSPDERRSQANEIRQSANTNLQSVLTPEQYAQWKNMTHHRVMPTKPSMGTNINTSAGSAP